MVLLTVLTALLVLLFFVVLTVALARIGAALRSIGGTPTSFLAKLRLGVRAIEMETSHLTPQVLKINNGLSQVAAGLASVDGHLAGTIAAVGRQEA